MLKSLGIAVLFSLLACGMVFAQAVSQISGVVRDTSGAVVPGVNVTATQQDTGIMRNTVTDDNGGYVLPNLPIGPYRLEAAKTGFKTYVQTGIELQVDSNPVVALTLGVGDVNQTVSVEANATEVETQKLGVGEVMENQRILELPLNGRTPTDLIALTGAAVQTGTSPSWSMNTGVTIAVGGGESYGVYYGLDGAPNINLYDATNLPLPFPDALQEFKVDTSTQNASSGMHSGAQVNAVTKSGSNGFHGDAFEFLRNGVMDARNFFAATTDTLKRSQFGGVIGGPIIKDKLFFFAGYQGTEIRQSPISTIDFIPTAAMLQGNFQTYASAACQGHQVNLGAPFVNNIVPMSDISPAALAISAKLPTTTNPCGQYLTGNLISMYEWQVPVRVDYQLSDKQTIFARWMGTKINTVAPYSLTPDNLLTTTGGSTNDLAQSATIGDTYLISPTMVNAFRVSLNRIGAFHGDPPFFSPSDVGINAYTNVPGQLWMFVDGAFNLGNGLSVNEPIHFTYLGANDDFSWIHGGHQFSFGGNLTHSLIDITANVRSVGNYTFNGQTTGLPLADFIVGDLSQMQQSGTNGIIVAQWFPALYAQDTWKVTSRLTLNYGLRWEPFAPMQVKDGRVYTFSLQRYDDNIHSTVFPNAPAGFYYPGDPGFNGKSGMDSHYADFEPRIGLAYDPFGDGKTAFRAGAGISYDFVNEQIYANENNVAPFSGDTVVNGPISLSNPWATYPGGDPFPYSFSRTDPRFTVGATYLPIPPALNTPKIYNWNAAIQRQFTPNFFASASYVGSQAIHLWTNIEENPAVFLGLGPCTLNTATGPTYFPVCSTTGNTNDRRVLNLANPQKALDISNLTAFDDGATSSYNAMILSTRWRATRTVNFIANYTWSHCIGDNDIGATVPNAGQNYVHANDRALDRGNCVSDRRNLFNLTAVAQAPNFSNKAMHIIVTGWALSAIYRYSSGAPLEILSGLDNALTGNSIERPNQVLGNVNAVNQGSACANVSPCVSWLNPAAFQQPALGTLGNMGAYNVLGPKFFQFDMALVRQFRIREQQHLELRGEAFNVTNSVRFNNPGVTLNEPNTFGVIQSAMDPRIMQVAAKFVF
jgi:hypothetical protein